MLSLLLNMFIPVTFWLGAIEYTDCISAEG